MILFQKDNSTVCISVCIIELLTVLPGYVVCARLIHEQEKPYLFNCGITELLCGFPFSVLKGVCRLGIIWDN